MCLQRGSPRLGAECPDALDCWSAQARTPPLRLVLPHSFPRPHHLLPPDLTYFLIFPPCSWDHRLAMRSVQAAAVVAIATAVTISAVAVAVAVAAAARGGEWAAAVEAVSWRASAVDDVRGGGEGTPPRVSRVAVEDGLRAALEPTAVATGAGATYAVGLNGRVTVAGAVGVAVPEHGVPMTVASVTDVGSITKQFTAFLVHWLADRGDVDLDADIRRYLPWLPRWDATVTLRHLLHQVSGLRDFYYVLYLGGDTLEGPFPRSRVLAAVGRQTRLRFYPGSAWEYSNTNSLLLAEVIEAVAGVSFAELLASVVTRPLGMNDTSVYDQANRVYPGLAQSLSVNISLPVTPDTSPETTPAMASRLTPAVGPGGILSTPVDMLAWSANMENNTLGGGQRLVAAMREPYVLRFANGTAGPTQYTVLGTSYGAGLFPLSLRAAGTNANATVSAWWHGGTIGGFQATLLQVPAAGIAVAIQTTAAQFGPILLLKAAIDAAAAAAPDVLAPLPDPPSPSPTASPPPAATMPPSLVELSRDTLNALAGVWVLVVGDDSGRDGTVFELQVDCDVDGGGNDRPPACRLLADFGPETLTHLSAASATRFIGSPVGVVGGLVLDVSLNGSHPSAAVELNLASVGGGTLSGTAHRPAALQLSRSELSAAAGSWTATELGATWTLTPRGGGLGLAVSGQEGGVVLSTLLPCCVDDAGRWRGTYTSRRLSPLGPLLGLRAAISVTAQFAPEGGGDTWSLTLAAGGDGRGDFRDIRFQRAPLCGA